MSRLFEIEKYNRIEGYERFKTKCVESSMKIRKKELRKTKKNKVIIMKEIEQMRKIVRWAESANIQEEKGNKIKKWRIGT